MQNGRINNIGNALILSFSTRARNGVLPLGGSRDQVVAEEHAVAECRATSVKATSPIHIGVGDEPVHRGRSKLEAMVKRALEVPKNSFDQGQMLIARVMHVEANL
jgi:hypothetical protein